jgi:hypothetical protein
MKTIVFYIVSTFTQVTVLSQYDSIVLTSIYNTRLHVVDSLSSLEEYMRSEFVVESSSGLPYTGMALKFYGNNGIDTLNFFNGVMNGVQKQYTRDSKSGNFYLRNIEFWSQIERITICNTVGYNYKKRYGYIIFYDDSARYYSFWFDYYTKSKKIVLKKREGLSPRKIKKRSRVKFKSLNEFQNYMASYPTVFETCVLIKLFDEIGR